MEISLNSCHSVAVSLVLVLGALVLPSSVRRWHVNSTLKLLYGGQRSEGCIFICSHTHIFGEVRGQPLLAALKICCHHQCFFFRRWMRTSSYLLKVTKLSKSCTVCLWVAVLGDSVLLFRPSQEHFSSTPAWHCLVSSSATAACRRPKAAVWRRSKHCLKTSSAPAVLLIQTRVGRSNTSESKVQTTIYRTTTHPTWTRESLSGMIVETRSGWVCDIFFFCVSWGATGNSRYEVENQFKKPFACISNVSEFSFNSVSSGIQKSKMTLSQLVRVCLLFSELRVNWRQSWS